LTAINGSVGSQRYVDRRILPRPNAEHGPVRGVSGLGRDHLFMDHQCERLGIVEAKSEAERLSSLPTNQILAALIDHAPDALLIVSSQGLIAFANATCTALLGYEPNELVGQSPEVLVPADVRAAHKDYRSTYSLNPAHRVMGRLNSLAAIRKDGQIIPVDIALNPIGSDEHGSIIAVALRDATAQRAFVNDLERMATTDPLTGALNRRSFENAFNRELERANRQRHSLFVMMLDIDHFKSINDRFGHDAGDKVLIKLVAECLSTVRKTDVLARLGGEEFVVLTPAAEVKEAMALAERIRENVAKIRMQSGGKEIAFTVSIGLCSARTTGEAVSDALKRADGALYEAKHSGRNRLVVRLP